MAWMLERDLGRLQVRLSLLSPLAGLALFDTIYDAKLSLNKYTIYCCFVRFEYTSFHVIIDLKAVIINPPNIYSSLNTANANTDQPSTPASGLHTFSNFLASLLLLLLSANQLLDQTHRPLLLKSPRPFLLLPSTLPLLHLGLRINTVLSIAVVVHGGVFVEADSFQTFGCVAEFV